MLSIANEVYPLIFYCIYEYFHQMVSEQSSISNCITCFVNFGIRNYSFMLLEADYHVRMLVVCSRKTIENCLRNFLEIRVSQVSINRESLSIDQVKLWSDLFKQIDFRLLVNRSNLFFDRSRGNQVSFEQVRQSGSNFLIFSIDRGTHSIDQNLEIQNFF